AENRLRAERRVPVRPASGGHAPSPAAEDPTRLSRAAITVVGLSALLASGVFGKPLPEGGDVQRLTMPAPSLHEASRTVRVYLPPTWGRAESAHRRYPVVYLLHGWPGSDGNWFGLGKAAATADS